MPSLEEQNDEVVVNSEIKTLKAEIERLKTKVNQLIDKHSLPDECPNGERKFCSNYQSDNGACRECIGYE